MKKILAVVLILFTVIASVYAGKVYKADDPTPSPEEVLILELINRFRANPKAEMEFIAPAAGQKPVQIPSEVDLGMFRKEVGALKPSPPLVFNLKLLDAARKHCHYMLLNGMDHSENQGKPGFTGVSPMDRTKAAGYKGSKVAENIFLEARGLLYSHIGFIVDWGKGGPGGMQPGRGHRKNMHNPDYREVGPGVLPNSQKFCVTHNFGDRRNVPRLVGGVVYVDSNGNNFYDIGEGKGGVSISTSDGKSSTTSWASGAYTLELNSTSPVTLVAKFKDLSFSKQLSKGSENVKFDCVISPELLKGKIDELIAEVEKIKPGSKVREKKRERAAVDLYLNTAGLQLDAERAEKVKKLVGDLGGKVDAAMDKVRNALKKGEKRDIYDAVRDGKKDFYGTEAYDWFKDAWLFYKLTQKVESIREKISKKEDKYQQKEREKYREALKKSKDKLNSTEFKSRFQSLLGKL